MILLLTYRHRRRTLEASYQEFPMERVALRWYSSKTTMEMLGIKERQLRRYAEDGRLEKKYKTVKPYKDAGKPNIDYAKCEELGIKDPDSVGSGYLFREGADHNEITLENEDVIEGIRAYIASRNDYLIVELEDGKEPADPEGTVFECKTALYQLYPAIYKGVSTAEGKTFSFNRGEKQNRYITNDAEEIKILRAYIASVLAY